MRELDPKLPIVAFQIKGFKNERWGVYTENSGADSVYLHEGAHTISKTIAELLKNFGLKQEHVINITAARDTSRDLGSHDFWLFVRNPHFKDEE